MILLRKLLQQVGVQALWGLSVQGFCDSLLCSGVVTIVIAGQKQYVSSPLMWNVVVISFVLSDVYLSRFSGTLSGAGRAADFNTTCDERVPTAASYSAVCITSLFGDNG